jgi:hypothetical protein
LDVAEPADGGAGQEGSNSPAITGLSLAISVLEAGGPGSSLALAVTIGPEPHPRFHWRHQPTSDPVGCSASLGGELACLPEIPVAEESDKNDNHERRDRELAAWDNVPGREQQ